MNAIDTNILVYAHQRSTPQHAVAFALVEELASGHEPWAIPWPCVYEFYASVTHRVWKERASTPERARTQIEDWLRSPSLRLLAETENTMSVLIPLLHDRVRGAKVHDARIAALCIAHGVHALYTNDRDFALFPELVIVNPFAPATRAGERRARYTARAAQRAAGM